MKRYLKLTVFAYLLLATQVLFAAQTAGDYVDDSILHSRVKSALVGNNFFTGMEINIEVVNGVVQLAGFVDSDRQRQNAGDLASNVNGVISLSNQLYQKSGQRSAGQVVDDTLIATRVKAGLGGDLSVNVDVYNGVVLLSGFVNNREEKDTAVTVAKSVSHVKKVIVGIDTTKK
jgi:hyperosmotically inducible protein